MQELLYVGLCLPKYACTKALSRSMHAFVVGKSGVGKSHLLRLEEFISLLIFFSCILYKSNVASNFQSSMIIKERE
jgi:hypothetical protein